MRQVLARLCVETALSEKEVQTFFAKKLQNSREKAKSSAATAAAATKKLPCEATEEEKHVVVGTDGVLEQNAAKKARH